MTLVERYKQGEFSEVWKEIYADLQNNKSVLTGVLEVLDETIYRVKCNVEVVLKHLSNNSDYQVKQTILIPESDQNIQNLKSHINQYGTIPFSLEQFYRIVGPVNFLQTGNDLRFEYADPLYIESINGIIEMLSDGSWEENMSEFLDEGNTPYLEISPDVYHKDNVSGGLPYGIELTVEQHVDSKMLNTKYGDLYFIEYLRICFENGGFPNIKENNEDCEKFIDAIKKEIIPF